MQLSERFPIDRLDELLQPPGTWQPVPPAADRAAWEACWRQQAALADRFIALADELMVTPWPSLPAGLARRFAADGDRSAWQERAFGRRQRLAACCLAACLTGERHYRDEVIDGLWLISEEASWCIPAHYHLAIAPRQPVQPLPRQDRELVDIFAAETAMVLAESYALLRSEIDSELPQIGERLRREVSRRVIEPVLAHDDWFWAPGQHNWSVWIVSNLLGAGGYLLDDAGTDRRLVARCLAILDRFLAGYGADGACNEGPAYWSHACGSLLLALECLHDRSAGAIDLFGEARFQAMCRYFLGVHLDGDQFATIADCPPQVGLPIAKLARMAERCAEPAFLALARRGSEREAAGADGPRLPGGGGLMDGLRRLWWVDPDALRTVDDAGERPLQQWWPSVQLLVARENATAGAGLVCAAKAGSNLESHNHNDVGQVTVVADARPLLIDPGVGTYTRQHFSPERYLIWTQAGIGHDAPIINGYEQAAGTGWGHVCELDGFEPVARSVDCRLDTCDASLAADLAACYPPEAGVAEARRRVQLLRAPSAELSIIDRIRCPTGLRRYEVGFWTPVAAEWLPDRDRFRLGDWWLSVTGPSLQGAVETRVLDDPQLIAAWGLQLHRLVVLVEPRGEVLEVVYRLRRA